MKNLFSIWTFKDMKNLNSYNNNKKENIHLSGFKNSSYLFMLSKIFLLVFNNFIKIFIQSNIIQEKNVYEIF